MFYAAGAPSQMSRSCLLARDVELLQIGSGVPVFAITRQMFSNGRCVEVADPIVIPGDRAVRVDRISI